MNDYVAAINAASHSASQQNKLLEKLMYLMWYEHMKRKYDMGPRGIYGHLNYELLAEKYYKEFDEKIRSWSVESRNIGEFV
jgi:hypothetical protein